MKRFLMIFIFIMGFIVTLFPITSYAYHSDKNINVLYLNSYHKGYKWSDDILEGIESQLSLNHHNIKLDVEYMDTRRVSQPGYLETLKDIYAYKFKHSQYDIILASDDKAYLFLQEYGEVLFPQTPIVFCGVNIHDDDIQVTHPMMTGILEDFDINATIDLASNLHPNLKNIYYINDDTITGKSVLKNLQQTIDKYSDRFNFIELTGANLQSIIEIEKQISPDSILLFLIYFRDKSGQMFDYAEGIAKISQNSPVPIYGVWDFHLGNGILGGKLTSGYYQGTTAAKIALRILSGEKPADIPITKENTSQYKFDFVQLKKHHIDLETLPHGSFVVNHNTNEKRKILMLNSYHKGLKWTDDIEKGLIDELGNKLENIEIAYEYMDLKHFSDPVALHNTRTFLTNKYKNTQFDLVIVTDDRAYQLALDYNKKLFSNTPIVFSGVNYFDASAIQNFSNITGVVEKNHYKETLELALNLQPNVKRVIVINDITLTGEQNRKNIEPLIKEYKDKIKFEFWSDVNMAYIQKNVGKLTQDDIIFLLSFNQDKSYNNFSYEESIELIAKNANVPIYGLWDFYLGKGLLGGKLTSGIVQGEHVGKIVKQILDGVSPADIPVVQKNIGVYMFDDEMLRKYGIKHTFLPDDSRIINKRFSLATIYANNKGAFLSIAFLICIVLFLFFIVFLLLRTNKIKRQLADQEHEYATTDMLTKVPNRRACFNYLNAFVADANKHGTELVIAFLDVNRLKCVNDIYGHTEGDELIKNICRLIQKGLNNDEKLCRMGGDEFLIIFHDISLVQAKKTWRSIETYIDDFNQTQNKPYTTSASIGFVEYDPSSNQTIDDLIDHADKKMYQNKISYRKKHQISDRRNT